MSETLKQKTSVYSFPLFKDVLSEFGKSEKYPQTFKNLIPDYYKAIGETAYVIYNNVQKLVVLENILSGYGESHPLFKRSVYKCDITFSYTDGESYFIWINDDEFLIKLQFNPDVYEEVLEYFMTNSSYSENEFFCVGEIYGNVTPDIKSLKKTSHIYNVLDIEHPDKSIKYMIQCAPFTNPVEFPRYLAVGTILSEFYQKGLSSYKVLSYKNRYGFSESVFNNYMIYSDCGPVYEDFLQVGLCIGDFEVKSIWDNNFTRSDDVVREYCPMGKSGKRMCQKFFLRNKKEMFREIYDIIIPNFVRSVLYYKDFSVKVLGHVNS